VAASVTDVLTDLVVEWRSRNPQTQLLLRQIAELPDGSPARYAAEAALHEWWAGWLHEQVGRALTTQHN
jgi:hypothetical protein